MSLGFGSEYEMRYVGYSISLVEELFFIGFVAMLVCLFAFDMQFSTTYSAVFSTPETFSDIFNIYLFGCSICYPVIVIVSAILETKTNLYGDLYRDMGIPGAVFFNIWNDIIYPVYLLVNKNALDPDDHSHATRKAMLYLLVWLIPVIFSVIGILVEFVR